MKKFIILWILACCCGSFIHGQKHKPHIENIRLDFDSNRFEIEYDITNSESNHLHQIDFYVIDNIGNVIFPDSLRGDIGKAVLPGRDKKIIWDIYSEYDVVHGSFDPRIVLDGSEKRAIKGGPSYAFLSVLVPGLGDYFVADYRKMKIKPYYKTAFTYSFVGLGIAALANRTHIPDKMGEPGWYREFIPLDDGKRIWIEVYRQNWIEEPGYTEYWLFRYDAEFFLGVGIAAWLVDVIWVARTGTKNKKVKTEIFNNLTLFPVRDGMALSFTYNF